MASSRPGGPRVYDLPDRGLPAELLEPTLTNEECLIRLAAVAGRALGVVTQSDLADYQRLRYGGAGIRKDGKELTAAGSAPGAGLVPGESAAGRDSRAVRAWLDPELPDVHARRGRHRTTLLSPFDSLIWDRKRTLRTFGFEQSLEAYVPQAKRVHGYYTIPLLAGGRLVGRVDPARSGSTLVPRKLTMDKPSAGEPMGPAP